MKRCSYGLVIFCVVHSFFSLSLGLCRTDTASLNIFRSLSVAVSLSLGLSQSHYWSLLLVALLASLSASLQSIKCRNWARFNWNLLCDYNDGQTPHMTQWGLIIRHQTTNTNLSIISAWQISLYQRHISHINLTRKLANGNNTLRYNTPPLSLSSFMSFAVVFARNSSVNQIKFICSGFVNWHELEDLYSIFAFASWTKLLRANTTRRRSRGRIEELRWKNNNNNSSRTRTNTQTLYVFEEKKCWKLAESLVSVGVLETPPLREYNHWHVVDRSRPPFSWSSLIRERDSI